MSDLGIIGFTGNNHLGYRSYRGKCFTSESIASKIKDIPFIFEKEGEEGFRKREAVVVDDLSKMDGVVLATGGGAVIDAGSRSRLGGRGFVVYLYTTVDQQVVRTKKGRERPLLENTDPRARLQELLDARDPLYREIADLVVETDGRKVKSVADEIIEQVS